MTEIIIIGLVVALISGVLIYKYIKPKPEPENSKPIGSFDEAISGKIARGWAFDADAGENPIDVHIYVDDKIYDMAKANKPRGDLIPVVGSANHGWECDISNLSKGTHTIKVYAINYPLGFNPELADSPKIITNPKPIGKIVRREETPYPGYFCAEVHGTRIIAGTYTGQKTSRLYSYKPVPNDLHEFVLADLDSGEAIYSICPCDGKVLIGTEGGGYTKTSRIFLWDGDKTFTKVDQQPMSGVYALIHDPKTKYSYAAYTNNHNIEAEIFASSNNTSWKKVWRKGGCQIKAGTMRHGCPQFFGYNFDTGWGFRVYYLNGKWNYQNLQRQTRYLDAFEKNGVCWLATSHFDGAVDPEDYMDAKKSSGVAKMHSKIEQVLTGKGEVGKSIKRSPYNGYLYFGELNWKSTTRQAQLWESKTGDKGTWKPITIIDPEITDQVFIDNRHFIFTKHHGDHGKILEGL